HDNFAHGYDFTDPNLSPEGQLVKQCMMAWETNSPKGQIRKVLQVIFNSDLFRSQAGVGQKVKTPLEFAVSAVRALRSSTNGTFSAGSFSAYSDGYAFATPLSRMGTMLLFDRDAPDGYPEAGPPWISGGTLAERIRFAQSFCIASGQSGHTGATNDAGNCLCNPVGLLAYKLPRLNPHGSMTNAANVVDYVLGILFPGEGAANLDLYRTAAINYLNTDDTGAASAFSALTVSAAANSTYDNRVRGVIAMLMATQRFQEQ
ncbi:MAG: DUF1800 family protein, partial [Verrucomicrobia bacterium]|nr:DUF1800 family protein [Verrucomicrobiota bacterium]